MRNIVLTSTEWLSLSHLQKKSDEVIPNTHRAKFLLLGVAAEKAGKLVLTFEGRLQLREYVEKTPSE